MRREPVVVEDDQPSIETGGGLHHADLEVGIDDEFLGHEAVDGGVPRRATHDVGFGLLVGHGDGGNHVGTEVDPEDEHGGQGERGAEREEADEGGDLCGGHGGR